MLSDFIRKKSVKVISKVLWAVNVVKVTKLEFNLNISQKANISKKKKKHWERQRTVPLHVN